MRPKTKKVAKRQVCPKVKELLRTDKLNQLDYDWIIKLAPDLQYKAAVKCMRDFNVLPCRMDNPKSVFSERNPLSS